MTPNIDVRNMDKYSLEELQQAYDSCTSISIKNRIGRELQKRKPTTYLYEGLEKEYDLTGCSDDWRDIEDYVKQ